MTCVETRYTCPSEWGLTNLGNLHRVLSKYISLWTDETNRKPDYPEGDVQLENRSNCNRQHGGELSAVIRG